MQPTDDSALLRAYCEDRSDDAFAGLVTRHINLVYSVAIRHVGNPHHAEEITQAVFIILAKKAATLRHHRALSSWLFQTTRLTANNFVRSEMRRQHREQEAYMQSTLDQPATDVWKQISPLVDTAVANLNEKDRRAIVLRFYEGRDLNEVGVALGTNEYAARKRVSRALEKLRNLFAKRGVNSATDTLARTISLHSVQVAPAALAKTVIAVTLNQGTAASISAAALAKATLITMKMKTIVATAATAVVLAGITTWLANFHLAQPPKKASPDFAAAGITFPIKLSNANFQGGPNQDPLFEMDTDPNTLRTSNSEPAIHIKGPLPAPPNLPANFPTAARQKAGEGDFASYIIPDGSPLLGQHVRITGWLKCDNVKTWANGYLCIYSRADNQFLRVDSMDNLDDRSFLHGTMDWRQIEFVTDIPDEPCVLFVGPDLYGPGELWGDDFQITLAPADAPITDDRQWRHTSAEPGTYSQSTDIETRHNGHAAVCLAYTGKDAATAGSWEWWGQKLRGGDVDNYVGHTVQWTGWVKLENVSNRLQPTIRPWKFDPYTATPSINARDKLANANELKGSRDWTQFSVTCDIPDDVNHIDTAFIFHGSGKVWIDMDSLKIKVVK